VRNSPPPLEPSQVDAALAEQSSGWAREGDRLVLERTFDGFAAAIAFVDRVATLAEAADHHPDIEVHFDVVRLVLWTHVAGAITQRDLDLAHGIAKL
jgi:4a-hydroxytetrahydrobiopterin dehydratase